MKTMKTMKMLTDKEQIAGLHAVIKKVEAAGYFCRLQWGLGDVVVATVAIKGASEIVYALEGKGYDIWSASSPTPERWGDLKTGEVKIIIDQGLQLLKTDVTAEEAAQVLIEECKRANTKQNWACDEFSG